jgi:Tfp pilus assembly PilM family ATPase
MFGNRRKGWIGIEWGTRTLRLAQVERDRGNLRIAASAVVSRPRDSHKPEDMLFAIPDWSADQLRTAVHSGNGFSGRSVACALPMHLTDLRQLTIPPGNDDERYAMVSNEIASAQGDAAKETVFDFWEPDGAIRQSTRTVNALSVPSDIVAKVTRTMTRAGLACEVLDGLPFSLSRAVNLMYGPLHAPLAVMHWGRISSAFCMVCDGMPLFTRHLRNCGMTKLLDTLSQALALPEDDIIQTLTAYGLPDDSTRDEQASEIQAVIADAAQSQLHEIVVELRRTMDYIGTQHADTLPERLCLTGDCATIQHVDRFLSSQIGLPVDIWNLPPTATAENAAPAVSTSPFAAAIALSALAFMPEAKDICP